MLTTANYSTTLDNAYLRRSNNLSDLTSVSTARTNLGLGTIATQNADNVSVSGGSINGATIGGTTSAAGTFTVARATTAVESQHFEGLGSEPGVSASSGAGSGASASLDGTDAAGAITLTTGTLPSISSTALTVTFDTAYDSAPYVVITPANQAAAALNGSTMIYVQATTTTFTFVTGTAGLTGSTTYQWNYHVMQ